MSTQPTTPPAVDLADFLDQEAAGAEICRYRTNAETRANLHSAATELRQLRAKLADAEARYKSAQTGDYNFHIQDAAEIGALKAALADWQSLAIWGGTPEHVHSFIKGQQERIRAAEGITASLAERDADSRRLDEITATLREYLALTSIDGVVARQPLRDKLRALAREAQKAT